MYESVYDAVKMMKAVVDTIGRLECADKKSCAKAILLCEKVIDAMSYEEPVGFTVKVAPENVLNIDIACSGAAIFDDGKDAFASALEQADSAVFFSEFGDDDLVHISLFYGM